MFMCSLLSCISHFLSNVSDLIGVPVFYFVLPLYSFWNLDDFSWGTTRVTTENASTNEATDALDKSNEVAELHRKKTKLRSPTKPALLTMVGLPTLPEHWKNTF